MNETVKIAFKEFFNTLNANVEWTGWGDGRVLVDQGLSWAYGLPTGGMRRQ
jgi:hypothetical protein